MVTIHEKRSKIMILTMVMLLSTVWISAFPLEPLSAQTTNTISVSSTPLDVTNGNNKDAGDIVITETETGSVKPGELKITLTSNGVQPLFCATPTATGTGGIKFSYNGADVSSAPGTLVNVDNKYISVTWTISFLSTSPGSITISGIKLDIPDGVDDDIVAVVDSSSSSLWKLVKIATLVPTGSSTVSALIRPYIQPTGADQPAGDIVLSEDVTGALPSGTDITVQLPNGDASFAGIPTVTKTSGDIELGTTTVSGNIMRVHVTKASTTPSTILLSDIKYDTVDLAYNVVVQISNGSHVYWTENTRIPLNITGTYPESNSIGIQVDRWIWVNLNVIAKNGPDFSMIKVRKADGTPVAIEPALSDDGYLLIKPKSLLEYDTTYIVDVPALAIVDELDNGLAASCSFSFTVESNPTSTADAYATPIIWNDSVTDEDTALPGFQATIHGLALPESFNKLIQGTDLLKGTNSVQVQPNGAWTVAIDIPSAPAGSGEIGSALSEDSTGTRSLVLQEPNRAHIAKLLLSLAGKQPNTKYQGYFSDVPETDWAWPYIEAAKDADILLGYTDGTFHPELHVTRGEFAKMLCDAKGLQPIRPQVPSFNDVSNFYWAAGYIEAAKAAGLLYGYADGSFRPWQNIKAYVTLQGITLSENPGGSSSSGGGSGGGSGSSSSITLPAPANLKVLPSGSSLTLSWDKVSDAKGYNIYRKDGLGSFIRINTELVFSTSYVDISAKPGKTYAYYVKAVGQDGSESNKSNEVSASLAVVEAEIIFSDIASNAWYKDYVSALIARKIVGGYANGQFRPNNKVTRGEFAKMICIAMGWTLINPSDASFSDSLRDNWSYQYIETAKSHGAISGLGDGSVRPNKNITRAEIAKIIATTLNLSSGSSSLRDISSHWAKDSITVCVGSGIVNGYGDNTFRPDSTATRAEAAKMIYGMLK